MKAHTFLILVSLLLAPWLNPFAPGPSPAVVPLLVAWLCATTVVITIVSKLAVGKLTTAIAWSWLVAGLVSCAFGLLQYFGAASDFSPWINQTAYGEAFANLRQRNQFATLTNISLIALLWLSPNTSETQSRQPTQLGKLTASVCWGCAGAVLMLGNAASSSRTGVFQMLLVVFVSGVWGVWREFAVRWIIGCAVVAYAVGAFALPYLAGLDLSMYGVAARLGQDDGCGSRLMLWSNVMHLIAQKPWLGWGWGELDYAHFITLYDEPRFCDILDNAHNLPLQLAVELGVPVALLVCGIFSWWVLRQKPWAERDSARQMAWAVMAVILLHSMLEYPLWYGPFQIAFGLCLVILWRSPVTAAGHENGTKNTKNTPVDLVNRAQAAISIVACSACLVAAAYAAWDYRRVSQIYLQPEARALAYQTNTLAEASKSWLFADQALFAELILTPLTSATAVRVYASAGRLLHYSPEPRVVIMLIESAVMLGKDDEALAYLARFKAAFPREHAAWAKANLIAVED